MTSHTISEVRPMPANENGRGNLAGYEARCSCGLEMRNTIRINISLDAADHLRWAEAQNKARRS